MSFVKFSEVTQSVSFEEVFDYYRLHYDEKGNELVLLCPFHDDHEPSLKANLTKGAWQCFGCGKHGNVIHFAADMEGVQFRDAALFLQAMFMTDHGYTEDPEVDQDPPKQMSHKPRTKGKRAARKPAPAKSTKRTGYMQSVEEKLLQLIEEEDEEALIKWVKEELLASYRRGQEAGKQEAALEAS